MKLLISILMLLTVVACADHERIENEGFIKKTSESEWSNNNKFDDLFKAYLICQKHTDYHGCIEIDHQLYDISTSLKSCLADQTSQLCKNIITTVTAHQITNILPESDRVSMPSHPFYITLPTTLLTELAPNFNYRKQSASWWWRRWKFTIVSCSLIFMFVTASLKTRKLLALNKKEELEKKNREIAELEELQRIKNQNEELEKQKKLQLEQKLKKARLEQEYLIAKEIEEEKNKKLKLEKLESEKKEAAEILSAVFKQID